jgi:hypothetical protein
MKSFQSHFEELYGPAAIAVDNLNVDALEVSPASSKKNNAWLYVGAAIFLVGTVILVIKKIEKKRQRGTSENIPN